MIRPVFFTFDNSSGLGGIKQVVAYGDFPLQPGAVSGVFANGIYRNGTNNLAVLTQQGKASRGVVQQGSGPKPVSGNSAAISQAFAAPAVSNVALISQQADRKIAAISQEGGYSFAALYQAGQQDGAQATINQYGSGATPNFALTTTTGFYSRISDVETAGGPTAGNFATIFQGEGAFAQIDQGAPAKPVAGNVAEIFQRGPGSSAFVIQSGSENFALLDQGPGNSNLASISQSGNQNYARSLQTGANNRSDVIQDGLGAISRVVQSGADGRIIVRQ